MSLRNASIGALAWISIVGSSACGGGSGSAMRTASLPSDEVALLEIAPSDAFFVARFDLRELRASSTWPTLEARLETATEEQQMMIHGTDRVYFAVGGLVDAPPAPPLYDSEGTYRRRPAWAELAEAFSGKVPAGVLIAEGRLATLCTGLLLEAENRGQSHGYTYGVKDGVVVMTRGENYCALTFEPVFERLLADSTAPSPTARRLAAVARGGSLGAASMAFELDAPSFRGLIDGIGPSPAREGAGNDAEAWAPIARRIANILMEGIAATEWEARATPGGFESIGRMQVTNHDRGVMWRELTSIYIQILDAVMSNPSVPESIRARYDELFTGVRLEEVEDGFILRTDVSASAIARIFEELPANAPGVPDVPPAAAVLQLPYQLEGVASATIETIEPRLEELDQLDPQGRADVLVALARSYRFVGRFDDAIRILTAHAEDPEDATTIVSPAMYSELCDIQLELGRGAQAKSSAEAGQAKCESVYCGDFAMTLAACGAVATAAAGDVPAALTKVGRLSEPDDDATAIRFGVARAQVLLRAGRTAEAAQVVSNVCLGRTRLAPCRDAAAIDAMLIARTASGQADGEAAILVLESRIAGETSMRRSLELGMSLAASRCELGSRLAPTEDRTQTTCSGAYTQAVAEYGATHPRTLVAAMGLVRTARARRDTATANTTLAAIDRVLATLGPNAFERNDRAALGGNGARRPQR